MTGTTRARHGLLAALLLLGAVGRAGAQTRTVAGLEGEYRLLPERSDDVASVVEQATSGRSWPVRMLMRDRLRKTLRPSAELRIELDGGQVTVTSGGEPPVHATLGAAPLPWTHPSGERMQVQAGVVDETLALTFQGRGATREQSYRLHDGGRTLEVRVALHGERLGGDPITYTLRYARLGGGAGR